MVSISISASISWLTPPDGGALMVAGEFIFSQVADFKIILQATGYKKNLHCVALFTIYEPVPIFVRHTYRHERG